MPYYPELPEIATQTVQTTTFLGLNRALVAAEGEMEDMTNLTSDHFPVLSTRTPRRITSAAYVKPQGMLGTDRLIVVDDGKVYVDGEELPGITLSGEESMQPKQMVAMGAYVCIWPDKVYFNLANPDDYGPMGAKWTGGEETAISAMMTRKDGRDYDMEDVTVSDTAPADPVDKQLWVDTSGGVDQLMQFSTIYGEWIQVATTYIKIQATGIGKGFREGDVIFLSGVAEQGAQAAAVSGQDSEELTFTTDSFFLNSSFNTTHQGGTNWVSTTPTIAERTKVITVTGIPEGAAVLSAKLTFHATSGMYGNKLMTVNGVSCSPGDNEVPVEVTGNGDVSLLFRYQSGNGANVSGSHSGSVTFSSIVLTVVWATTGATEHQLRTQLEALNTSNYLYGCGDDYIIVAGMLRRNVALFPSLVAELRIPDLDYVTESGNRIWGCSYARADGVLTNELRSCSLGDFRNWYLFEGTSMDSYVVSIGSDGKYTGAATMMGNPLFFKESCMHKVSGTEPSNFSVSTTMCRGVQDGCSKSIAVVGQTMYYKSRAEVMAFDGAMPYPVSEKLGHVRGYEACGAAFMDKYYLAMCEDDLTWSLYVYDTQRQLWHREDDSVVHHMANVQGVLHMMRENGAPQLVSLGGMSGEVEQPFAWEAKFGVFGLTDPNQKYLSRYNIRAQLTAGSEMTLLIRYDSHGDWEKMGTMRTPVTRTFLLPVVPRRCDHLQVMLRGKGDAKIYSISRTYEQGGDGGYGTFSRPAYS